MASSSTAGTASLFDPPSTPVGYVAILMALVTGVLHLVVSADLIEVSEVLAALVVHNGLGFLAGAALYLTRYWRRPLFLVAAAYSVVTILALFSVQGWGVEAFYVAGSLSLLAVISKAAEAILAVCALYLYVDAGR